MRTEAGGIVVEELAVGATGGAERPSGAEQGSSVLAGESACCCHTLDPRAPKVIQGGAGTVGGPDGRISVDGRPRVDVVAKGKRCRARMCPRCGPVLGRRVRARLLERAAALGMERPIMLTLTVDMDGTVTHRGFKDPATAHRYVAGNKFIARLMRALGCDTWAWVLEFQMRDRCGLWHGRGTPHWHVLMDAGRCPGGRVDYQRAWDLWRKEWRVGGLKFPEKGTESFRDSAHAVRYITKYLVKFPMLDGFPTWAIDAHSVRFVGSSKRVGALVSPAAEPWEDPQVGDDPLQEEDQEEEEVDSREGHRRPYRERLVSCSSACELWRRVVMPDGTVTYKWIGQVEASPAELGQMLDQGLLAGGSCEERMGGPPEMVFAASMRVDDLNTSVKRLRAAGWVYVPRDALPAAREDALREYRGSLERVHREMISPGRTRRADPDRSSGEGNEASRGSRERQ